MKQLSPEILKWHEEEYTKNLPCKHLKDDLVSAFVFHKMITGEVIVICLRCQRLYRGKKAKELMVLYGVIEADLV